jgi:hypothetical protein
MLAVGIHNNTLTRYARLTAPPVLLASSSPDLIAAFSSASSCQAHIPIPPSATFTQTHEQSLKHTAWWLFYTCLLVELLDGRARRGLVELHGDRVLHAHEAVGLGRGLRGAHKGTVTITARPLCMHTTTS